MEEGRSQASRFKGDYACHVNHPTSEPCVVLLLTVCCAQQQITASALSCRISSGSWLTLSMVGVLTYNIHSGVGGDGVYDLERIAGVVRRSGADVVCLQEVQSRECRPRWSSVALCRLKRTARFCVCGNGLSRVLAAYKRRGSITSDASSTNAKPKPFSMRHADNQPQQIAAMCGLPHFTFSATLTATFSKDSTN